jgi:hypothetical protein
LLLVLVVVLLFILVFLIVHIHLHIVHDLVLRQAPPTALARCSRSNTWRASIGLQRLRLPLGHAHAFAMEPIVAYVACDHEYLLIVGLAT